MANTRDQSWDPQAYARNGRFVADLAEDVVALLAPQPGEQVLDLGCGDGVLTARLQAHGATVVGVDASADMVAAARERGVDARVMDGQDLAFEAAFDAVFSNAALHWLPQGQRVIDGVRRALKPGGRFVAEMGGAGNVASIVAALETALAARGLPASRPWFFPAAETYRAMLEAGGFTVATITLFDRPTPLPGDMPGWLATFAHPYLSRVPADQQDAVLAEVTAALRPQLCDADGQWVADYRRLRFRARLP